MRLCARGHRCHVASVGRAWARRRAEFAGAAPVKGGRIPGSTNPVLPPDGQQKTATEITPDDSAVRYYASRNETVRVNAEIGRLKRLYPGWQPPKACMTPQLRALKMRLNSGASSQQIVWTNSTRPFRRARHRNTVGNLRRISNRRFFANNPLKISEYLKQDRWQEIVDYVHAVDLSVDAEVDVLWAVAEAFARTKQTAESRRLYGVILTNDKSPAERISTIQKAMANLRMADVEPLIAMGAQANGGSSEFAPIMIDITRARISAYLHTSANRTSPIRICVHSRISRAPLQMPIKRASWGGTTNAHRNYGAALEWFQNCRSLAAATRWLRMV